MSHANQPFEALARPMLDRLYRFAHKLTRGDVARAEDLLQQSLLTGFTRIDQLQEPAAFPGWMMRIVHRTWLNQVKRKTEDLPGDLNVVQFPDPSVKPDRQADARQVGKQLQLALARLPEDQAKAVWLVDGQGFQYAEVAEILDIAPGTAASRVARGRAALRVHLEQVAREQGVIS